MPVEALSGAEPATECNRCPVPSTAAVTLVTNSRRVSCSLAVDAERLSEDFLVLIPIFNGLDYGTTGLPECLRVKPNVSGKGSSVKVRNPYYNTELGTQGALPVLLKKVNFEVEIYQGGFWRSK